jgi:hypothetical protein
VRQRLRAHERIPSPRIFIRPLPPHGSPFLTLRTPTHPTTAQANCELSQRLKEMKQLTRDTGGSLKSRSSEANSEIQRISLSTSTAASASDAPRRRPVFRAIGSSNAQATTGPATLTGQLDVKNPSTATAENDPSGAVRNGWYSQRYEPEFISGCGKDCSVCGGKEECIAI